MLFRREEALREQRHAGRRTRRAQVVDRAGETRVDEHGDRVRAVACVKGDELLHTRVRADVAERGRAPLELGDGREPRLAQRVGESHACENSTSSWRRAAATPESIASRARTMPSRRFSAWPAAAIPPAALRTTAERWPPEVPSRTARSPAALWAGSPPRSSEGSKRSMPRSAGSSSYSRTVPFSTSHTRFGPHGDSSSMPPAPWTTYARSAPSRTSASASVRVSAGEYTPSMRARAPAGFVSGPSTLNTVRVASSRRTGAACLIAG